MVDAPDLKSVVRMGVGVQVPPLAPRKLFLSKIFAELCVRFLHVFCGYWKAKPYEIW